MGSASKFSVLAALNDKFIILPSFAKAVLSLSVSIVTSSNVGAVLSKVTADAFEVVEPDPSSVIVVPATPRVFSKAIVNVTAPSVSRLSI